MEILINRVLEQIKKDINIGDISSIAKLLHFVPKEDLIGFLPVEEWELYGSEFKNKINHIKSTISKFGDLIIGDYNELEGDSIYNSYKDGLVYIIDEFYPDNVCIKSYNIDSEIPNNSIKISYEELSHREIDAIYFLIQRYEELKSK